MLVQNIYFRMDPDWTQSSQIKPLDDVYTHDQLENILFSPHSYSPYRDGSYRRLNKKEDMSKKERLIRMKNIFLGNLSMLGNTLSKPIKYSKKPPPVKLQQWFPRSNKMRNYLDLGGKRSSLGTRPELAVRLTG